MALKRKKPTRVQMVKQWLDNHNKLACSAVAAGSVVVLVGLFLFVTMSGFGASADFVYNQF